MFHLGCRIVMKKSCYVDKFTRTANPSQDFPQKVFFLFTVSKAVVRSTKTDHEKIFVLFMAFLLQLPGCKNHFCSPTTRAKAMLALWKYVARDMTGEVVLYYDAS